MTSQFRNPFPIGVAVVPVIRGAGLCHGLLTVRRAIEPSMGQLALPGGYLEQGESWRDGVARELWEETGIRVADPATIEILGVESNPQGTHLLLFGLVAPILLETVAAFQANGEVSELVVIEKPTALAFPLHTAAAEKFFRS